MKTKPTLTDEEIRSHMDFDKLLQLHKAGVGAVNTVPKWLKIIGYTGPTVLIISAIIYSIWPSTSNQVQQDSNGTEQNLVTKADSVKLETPVAEIVKKEEATQVTAKANDDAPVKNQSTEVVTSKSKQEIKQPKVPVFIQAEPVSGYPELYAYFNRELQYPVEALNDSIEGVVSVSFAIDRLGKPTDILINNSLGVLFDAECKRVIENMPEWRPATVNGTPISTRMSIPLTFQVKKN